MKVLRVAFCAYLTVISVVAQEAAKGPSAEVKIPAKQEALLKQQVGKFWQFFVEGKFRAADTLVAEESKEDFFVWPKKQIRGFRYEQAFYTAGGKEAKVVVVVDTDLAMMGVGSMRIEKPVHTWWKLIKGNWYWFQPKNEMRETPFGKEPTNLGSGKTAIEAMGQAGAPTLESLRNAVRMDKTDLKFVQGVGKEEELVITNTMPGTVLVNYDAPRLMPELEVRLESNKLARESKGRVFVKYDPAKDLREDKSVRLEREFRVGIPQTGRSYLIKVTIEPAPKP